MKDVLSSLPSGSNWKSTPVSFEEHGYTTATKTPTLYFRDAIECVRLLYGDPRFKGHIRHTPYKEYSDLKQNVEYHGSFLTSMWAHNVQVRPAQQAASSDHNSDLQLIESSSQRLFSTRNYTRF
jgi:hypothetical protein